MHRADQHSQQQITDLVEACAGYWELRGVARESSQEMQLELEQHLQQAVTDGKSLEAVLGPNPLIFANAWAREMRPRVFLGGAVVIRGLVYVLSVVSTSALLALLLQLGGFLAPRLSSRAGREALLLTGVVLAVLVLRLAGMKVNWSMALLSWSWPTTIVLLALTVFPA